MSRGRTPTARMAGRAVGVAFAAATALFGGVSLTSELGRAERIEALPLGAQVTAIDVSDIPGAVTVTAAAGREPALVQTVRTGLSSPDVSFGVAGTTATYFASCPWFGSRCGVDLTAFVPRTSRVRVRSSSDDVNARGLAGMIDLQSSAGSVTVTGGAGTMTLASSAGDVRVAGAAATRVDASSIAGDVRLALTTAPDAVRAESSAGDVEIVLPDGPEAYRVESTTSAGEVRTLVRTDPTSSRVIRAESSAGDVTVRYATS